MTIDWTTSVLLSLPRSFIHEHLFPLLLLFWKVKKMKQSRMEKSPKIPMETNSPRKSGSAPPKPKR
jgi:hypothetical protein